MITEIPPVKQIKNDLTLWLPGGATHLTEQYIQAQQAVTDFLRLGLTPVDFLETLAAHGVDMDDYLDAIEYNLNH